MGTYNFGWADVMQNVLRLWNEFVVADFKIKVRLVGAFNIIQVVIFGLKWYYIFHSGIFGYFKYLVIG